jgi:hypothetical protein
MGLVWVRSLVVSVRVGTVLCVMVPAGEIDR